MVDLAPIFLRGCSPTLVAERSVSEGIKGWLVKSNYGIDLGSPGEFVLNGIVASTFYPYLFGDYVRFAMAAKESIHHSFAVPFDKRATAWALISRYYSAFFSAHALLRSQGRGVTWLDSAEAGYLERIGKLYIGPGFIAKRGGYSFEFSQRNGFDAELRLVSMSYGSGSHDDFWRVFLSYLAELGSRLLTQDAPLAADGVGRLSEVQRIINARAAKGMWLSFMRNEINYQHRYGVWYPFPQSVSGASCDRRKLAHTNAVIDLSMDASRSPLEAFNAVTCFLAALNSDLATLIKERVGDGAKNFRTDWNRLHTKLSS